MTKAAFIAIMVTFLVLSGCQSAPRLSLIDANGSTVHGMLPSHFVITKTYPWVIFFHGYAQLGTAIYDDPQVSRLANALTEAGYVVASPDYRIEECWGNALCIEDSTAAYNIFMKTLKLDPKPFVLGQSMGGLVVWNSVAHGSFSPRAAAGIYPACSLLALYRNPSFTSAIESDYSFKGSIDFGSATKGYDPLGSESLQTLVTVPTLMWSSYSDTIVSRRDNEDPFAATINKAGGNAAIITTRGDHGDDSNFDPGALLAFFNKYKAADPKL